MYLIHIIISFKLYVIGSHSVAIICNLEDSTVNILIKILSSQQQDVFIIPNFFRNAACNIAAIRILFIPLLNHSIYKTTLRNC